MLGHYIVAALVWLINLAGLGKRYKHQRERAPLDTRVKDLLLRIRLLEEAKQMNIPSSKEPMNDDNNNIS